MKTLILSLCVVFSSSALACLSLEGRASVCPGDLVYTNYFNKGARVKAVNPRSGQVLLESTVTRATGVVIPAELYVSKGCLEDVCVGDGVYTEYFKRGAKVLGLKPSTYEVMVKSTHTGFAAPAMLAEIMVTDFCLDFDAQRGRN